MSFAYFGCIDIHPLSPFNDLDPTKYMLTTTRNGARSFRYEQTEYGLKVELYPGTVIEDIKALFREKQFKELLKGKDGSRLSLIKKSGLYRQFSLIMDEIYRAFEGQPRPSEQEILDYFEEHHPDFFKTEFRPAMEKEDGMPFSVLENYKKRAGREYGFIDQGN